jgi:hypothetical protein
MIPRALVSSALLLALGLAAPASAGTAVALASDSGHLLTLLNFKADPNRRPKEHDRLVREAQAIALAPDGTVALGFEPGTGKLHAIQNDGSGWAIPAPAPRDMGWISTRSGRLLNLGGDGARLVDAVVAADVDVDSRNLDIDVADCAQWEQGSDAVCVGGGRELLRISPDAGVVDHLPGPGSGAFIEPGLDGNVVIADSNRIVLVDPHGNVPGLDVQVNAIDGINSDPRSALLLVQVGALRVQLRDLATLQLLRELTLTGEPVRQAALLRGGTGILVLRESSLDVLDMKGNPLGSVTSGGETMVVGWWSEPPDPLGIDAASQGSVDDVNSKLDARLDVAVSSRASQASVDQANAKLDATVSSRASQASMDQANARLDAAVSSRASQASVDALAGDVAGANARLDVAVSTRASQSSVDQANARLDATVSSRATQSSVDAMAGDLRQANAQLDVAVSSRASQASVDRANAQLDVAVSSRASQASVDRANAQLDASVSSRATQVSVDGVAGQVDGVSVGVDGVASQVDAVGTDVDTVAADVAAMHGLVDVAVSSRASQSSVDGVASRVTRIDGLVDAPVGSRATQDSVDALADRLDAAADDAAEAQARLLEAVTTASRRGIENALLSNVVEPMFLIPGGRDADPALDGATCPGLAPAGHAAVHPDGLFESVRCVTRRAIDAMAAIGEDTRSAERYFASGEAERGASSPHFRAAVDDYARALGSLSRGH